MGDELECFLVRACVWCELVLLLSVDREYFHRDRDSKDFNNFVG